MLDVQENQEKRHTLNVFAYRYEDTNKTHVIFELELDVSLSLSRYQDCETEKRIPGLKQF